MLPHGSAKKAPRRAKTSKNTCQNHETGKVMPPEKCFLKHFSKAKHVPKIRNRKKVTKKHFGNRDKQAHKGPLKKTETTNLGLCMILILLNGHSWTERDCDTEIGWYMVDPRP